MTLNITVIGKVQGVGFRDSTKEVADKLNIRGTVQNLDNGNLLILAQGKRLALNQFLDWCHKGPSNANVTKVVTEEVEDSHFLKNFIVKRW